MYTYYAVENPVERNKLGNQYVDRYIGCADLNLNEVVKEECLQSRELVDSTYP